jgi:hypothetical protein
MAYRSGIQETTMRIIPTRIHGLLDYGMGVLLILAPWIFSFADGGARQWAPIVLGAGAILYSLVTDYELGVARMLPMPVHLGLDAASGVFLALSPWLFSFAGAIWWPHVVFGLLEVSAALMTQTAPADEEEPRRTARA